MHLDQQKQILKLYNRYTNTPRDTIKANIKRIMDRLQIKPAKLAELTEIPIQTIYQFRQHNNQYKPDFITALIICDTLKVSITELIQPIADLKIPQLKSRKWSITAKKNFITDYKNLPITELCNKYNITPRKLLKSITGYLQSKLQT